MSESRASNHDRHDPRGGREHPTGPQGTAEQAAWQKGKSGEAAVKEASTKRRAGQQ